MRFMVNQCPFLLETFTWINNNIFPFQQHLKVTCDFLPLPTHVCFFPLEQFIEQQMGQLQNSISELCTVVPFLTCFSTRYLRPIMLKFYHVLT
jgi:hypothetical protein